MFSTNPDAFLLCISPHDDIQYINRTVNYLQSIGGGKVIGLVLFPLYYEESNIFTLQKHALSNEELMKYKNSIKNQIGIDTYIMNENKDILSISDSIIKYFSDSNVNSSTVM